MEEFHRSVRRGKFLGNILTMSFRRTFRVRKDTFSCRFVFGRKWSQRDKIKLRIATVRNRPPTADPVGRAEPIPAVRQNRIPIWPKVWYWVAADVKRALK